MRIADVWQSAESVFGLLGGNELKLTVGSGDVGLYLSEEVLWLQEHYIGVALNELII